MRAARWGDNDRYLGPFTWSYSPVYRNWAVVLKSSGDGDSNDRPCTLRISMRKLTLILVLPNVIKPWRTKVYPGWDKATIKRLGRDWYWDVDPRQYGVSLYDGHLSVSYGRTGGACMDSRIQQQWGCFLPWTQWRHIRHSMYGLHGEHFWTEWEWVERLYRKHGGAIQSERWEILRERKDMCPAARFTIADFDGEEVIATTRIEEREWRFGTGWFKWLSWFRRPKIRRSLAIEFSGETGREKGSWKGGTIGCGIDMLPGELHETAFRRYCDQEHRAKSGRYRVTFIGRCG